MKSLKHAYPSLVFAGILILTLHPNPAACQPGVKVYSLEQGIEEALENSWDIKIVQDKISEATHVKEQARAEFYPKLSTSYSYTRLSDVSGTDAISIGGGLVIPGTQLNARNNYQWKVSLTQPLFTGFALTSSHELAKYGVDLTKIQLKSAKLDLVLQVKEAYFGILTAEKSLEVADKAVASLSSNVDVTRSFYKVGMIPVNDLLKVEVELANAKQNRVRAQNAVSLAKSSFNRLLARPVDAPVNVVDILIYRPEEGNLQAYVSEALANRPEIQEIDVSLQQADEQIRLAKSLYYPEVALVYDYIKEGNDPSVSGSDFHEADYWQLTAGLTWTFFEWGKKRSGLLEKESLKRQILKTRKSLEDAITLQLQQAVLELEAAARNIPTTEKAVEQAEENLRVSEERYQAQVTTITEVLDAQTLLTQARTNYYNALYDHNLAKAALARARGTY